MKAEFNITLSCRDMYRFSMYHAYTGSQGVISILIAILCFVVSVWTYGSVTLTYTILYAVFGVLFLVYIPVNLYLHSKRQFLKSEVLQNPLHYVIDEDGVHTSQNGETAELPWEQIYKMISTKRSVLIYSSRVNAYIIPKEQVLGEYDMIRTLAQEKLPGYRCRMK